MSYPVQQQFNGYPLGTGYVSVPAPPTQKLPKPVDLPFHVPPLILDRAKENSPENPARGAQILGLNGVLQPAQVK